MDDLTGLLLWGESRLTCIVKTISPCLSSHEDVNTFRFQQATIFTSTLLFQPQLITTFYIQLQIIINRQFVVLRTCTQTLFHTQHSREMRNISDTKCALQTRSCLMIVSVQSARFIAFKPQLSLFFLSGSGSRYTIKFLIWGCIT